MAHRGLKLKVTHQGSRLCGNAVSLTSILDQGQFFSSFYKDFTLDLAVITAFVTCIHLPTLTLTAREQQDYLSSVHNSNSSQSCHITN